MDEKEGETQLFPKAKKEINDFVQRVEEHIYPDETQKSGKSKLQGTWFVTFKNPIFLLVEGRLNQ